MKPCSPRSPAGHAGRERETQIAYAQGVLDVSYASRTYEFDDKEDSDPDSSEVLSAHDIIDAERFAERHEEDDVRSAAERRSQMTAESAFQCGFGRLLAKAR